MDRSAELRRTITAKNTAYRASDVAGYLAAYAPDATIYDRGELTFEDLRGLVLGQFASGDMLEYAVSAENIRMLDSGDIAIVSYRWREKFKYRDGRVTDIEYYESNVWRWRDAVWRMLHVHISVVQEHPGVG